MGWVPSKKSVGGLYTGRDFLNVSMTNWVEKGGASVSGYQCIVRNGNMLTPGSSGFSGTIGDAYLDYKVDHTGTSSQLICEFEITKPKNAGFRRHTMKFYFNSSFDYTNYRGSEFYNIGDVDFTFTRCQYNNDGTASESQIAYFRTAAVILGKYCITDYPWGDGGFYNASDMLFNVGSFVANDTTYFGFGVVVNATTGTPGFIFRLVGYEVSQLATIFGVDEEDFGPVVIDDPNYDENDKTGDWFGGDGDHDDHSDDIEEPDILDAGVTNTGLVTLCSASVSLLQQFAGFLWDLNFITEIVKFFTKPTDWIISVKMFPLVPVATEAVYPKWGSYTWPVPLSKIEDQYVEVDCGSMYIDPYWGNCFDYDPYTRIEIWLPYIGYRDLPVDLIMCHNLHCRYEVDLLTGCCTAILSIDAITDDSEKFIPGADATKVIGQYYGNCGVDIPITSASNDGLVQTMAAAAGTFLNKAIPAFAQQMLQPPEEYSDFEASVNVGSGFVSALGTTVKGITAMKTQPSVSGSSGMTYGLMSVQKPFIHIKRPHQDRPENFRRLHGYMSNMSGTLSEFSGYAEVDSIELNNVPAFEPELKEIVKLLKGGVII